MDFKFVMSLSGQKFQQYWGFCGEVSTVASTVGLVGIFYI